MKGARARVPHFCWFLERRIKLIVTAIGVRPDNSLIWIPVPGSYSRDSAWPPASPKVHFSSKVTTGGIPELLPVKMLRIRATRSFFFIESLTSIREFGMRIFEG